MKLSALLLPAVLLLTACSTLSTHFEPQANVAQLKHIFVVQNLNDNHGMASLIVRQLQARGLQSESGPLTLMPSSATVYLNYDDHWDWDFKDYLISLNVTLRDANSDRLLASATYFRPTAFMKTPEFMAATVLDSLFKHPANPAQGQGATADRPPQS